MKKIISRRDALKLIGLTTVGGALAACSPAATPTEAPLPTQPAATTAAEVPAATAPAVEPTAATAATVAVVEPTTAPAPADMPVVDVKISLWDIANSFPEGEPDAIGKYVMDKFKINIVPVNVGWGDADEKYNTWAASGQLPDVIGGVAMVGNARYFQWINDGVLRPLPDISAYSEISKLMQGEDVTAYAVEGKNYFLPRFIYADAAYWAMDRGMIARKDWMEKVGMTDPKTEQDYIDMCVAFAKEDPDGNGQNDTVGMTPDSPGSVFSQYFAGYGYTDLMEWVKDENGNYVMPVAGEKAFVLGQFLKKMYKAGGLDPDFATLESSQALEKFAAGKAGILVRQVSPKHLKAVMDPWVKAQPDKDFVESIVLLPGPSVDGSYTRFTLPSYWAETYFEANVDDVKADRVLQLYNWLYSKEGMYMMQYGMEGTDYKMTDGNVELLTPVDPETGLHKSIADIYPFTYAMNYLAAWTSDFLQYEDPNIPEGIRKMATAERDNRIANWIKPDINWKVQGVEVPEKQEMSSVTFGDDWVKFIMDTSGKPDRDLYEAMKKNWDANGYAAAVEAITAKAKELGID